MTRRDRIQAGRTGVFAIACLAACFASACGGAVDAASAVEPVDAGDAHLGFGFPLGTYSDCSINISSDESGWGGNVTLAKTDAWLTASFTKETGTSADVMDDFSLTFDPTSDTSATLVSGQSMTGVNTFACTPLSSAKITLRLSSGALTYDADELFLSTVGVVVDPTGKAPCRTGDAHTLTITCRKE